MNRWSVTPLATLKSHSGRSGAGAPAGLLLDLAGSGHLRDLAGIDAAGGDLPAELVGDEAMAPEQEDATVGIGHDGTGGMVRRPHDVVIETVAARQLDVGEPEAHPGALVE